MSEYVDKGDSSVSDKTKNCPLALRQRKKIDLSIRLATGKRPGVVKTTRSGDDRIYCMIYNAYVTPGSKGPDTKQIQIHVA